MTRVIGCRGNQRRQEQRAVSFGDPMTDQARPSKSRRDEAASASRSPGPLTIRPIGSRPVQAFFVALAALLLGYMFLGRGFAHVGLAPIYVGEIVLALGLVITGWAVWQLRARPRPTLIVWLLVSFMLLGAARTIPYIGQYGMDALRDGVLWGYGFFALMVYVLAGRVVVARGMRLYGWVVPVFAVWLPISWTIFRMVSSAIDPARPGEVVPLVFFKSGDMAVHIAGSIAFLAFGVSVGMVTRAFLWRAVIAVPLAWTALVGWATNRGSLVALATAVAVALLIGRRWRDWTPLVTGAAIAMAIFLLPSAPSGGTALPATAFPTPTVAVANAPSPTPRTRPTPTPSPVVQPAEPAGRELSGSQLIENFISIFVPSADGSLSGTRAFRLAWWSEIVDYTVFGPHFWTGKGFGVNLATDDGFQATADQSLRAPHNSHMTALARMGVPGFVLWLALQGTFGVTLLRATWEHRRRRDLLPAAAGAWILVYWVAMMVNTSFDPYLEGPQGGIWFWTLFGLGLIVIRLRRPPSVT